MKTRLLKRLRKEAKKLYSIHLHHWYYNNGECGTNYIVESPPTSKESFYWSANTLEKAEKNLAEARRRHILARVARLRFEKYCKGREKQDKTISKL